MNNNRNQNNRRRGRGNRNQGSGGGSQGNRIDSRARGNAPQLLDKYKKLAEDAHRNGDRVQAEYYLQFADHYFRVIADNRARQDEQRGDQRPDGRGGRRDEREQDDFDVADDENEGEDARRYESRDKRDTRRERPRRDDNRNGSGNRDYRRDESDGSPVEASEGPAYEPEENPFTRDSRANRDDRPGRDDRDEREPRPKRRAARPRRDEESDTGFDAAVLPPSISANDSGPASDDDEVAEKAPRPRRKRGEGGTLSAVG